MEKGKAREWWIHKGSSCFADEMLLDPDELFPEVKCQPDGFYDLISPKDTIEGGIHVREVIELTDDEKRRVEDIRKKMKKSFPFESYGSSDERFLFELLERAGVIE